MPLAWLCGSTSKTYRKLKKMKIAICIAAVISAGHALAQAAPLLTYESIVAEARRYDKLEGSERVISSSVFQKMVKLDLKPFGGGSADFYVTKKDEIGFICTKSEPGFAGGVVVAQVTKHQEFEGGSHFYTLNYCTKTK